MVIIPPPADDQSTAHLSLKSAKVHFSTLLDYSFPFLKTKGSHRTHLVHTWSI